MIPKNAKSLPRTAKKVWLARDVLLLIPGLVLWVGINYVFQSHWSSAVMTTINVIFSIGVLIVVGHILLIPYYYRYHKYLLTPDAVTIYQGFFLRKTATVPVNRIQNVDTQQGPLLQYYHLQSVVVVTAAHNFKIEAIAEDVAQALRDQLIASARQAREVETDD